MSQKDDLKIVMEKRKKLLEERAKAEAEKKKSIAKEKERAIREKRPINPEAYPSPDPDKNAEMPSAWDSNKQFVKKAVMLGQQNADIDLLCAECCRHLFKYGNCMNMYEKNFLLDTTGAYKAEVELDIRVVLEEKMPENDKEMLKELFYSDADGVMLVADARELTALETLPDKYKSVVEYAKKKLPIVYVMNNIDDAEKAGRTVYLNRVGHHDAMRRMAGNSPYFLMDSREAKENAFQKMAELAVFGTKY